MMGNSGFEIWNSGATIMSFRTDVRNLSNSYAEIDGILHVAALIQYDNRDK